MMKKMLLIIIMMFSISIANNQFGVNKINSIQQILQNGITSINTSTIQECNDLWACNYNPTAENNDGCIYMAENECDCEGNVYDCSGECGGDNTESCVIMNPEIMGFYDNSDCIGEFNTSITGLCMEDEGFSLTEELCTNNNGIWMYFDTCYTFDFYTYSAVEVDFDNMNECFCGDGGEFDEYNEECTEGEEEQLTIWLTSENFKDMFNLSQNGPNLYFYNDGSFGESNIDTECYFLEIPSQEDCEYAGGYYDDDSE